MERGPQPPSGGLPDKIGNRYKGRLAVLLLLQFLDQEHDSVRFRFEQPGEDSFEWWIEHGDGSRSNPCFSLSAMVTGRSTGNDRGWFGRIEMKHDVQPECTDLGEQASGQDAASLTVLAAEAETQLQVAVDGQARQLIANPVNEFDQRSHMVREVAVISQAASPDPDAGFPSSTGRIAGTYQTVPLELLVRRDPQPIRDLAGADPSACDPDRPGRPLRDRRCRLHP